MHKTCTSYYIRMKHYVASVQHSKCHYIYSPATQQDSGTVTNITQLFHSECSHFQHKRETLPNFWKQGHEHSYIQHSLFI